MTKINLSEQVSALGTNGQVIYNNAGTLSAKDLSAATNFSLNGSSSSVSLIAGANITLNSGASSITIVGPSGGAAGTNTISASGTSIAGTALSFALAAGVNISLQTATAASSMTVSISGIAQTSTQSLTALGNTTISSAGTFTTPLNISGAGIISVGVGAGSVTISATTPSVTNFSTISLSASGNTAGMASSSGTANNVIAISGMGIITVGAGNGSISISATTPSVTNFSTVSLTALGNTTISSAGTFNNLVNISGAGAASIGVGAGSVTVSVPVATNFALNGSSSSVSLVAGSNIGFASNASTITISGSNQVQNFGISSSTAAGGTTAGTTTVATGPILLVAGSNINLSSSAGAITISASAGGGAAGTQSLSAGANSVTGTAVSLAIVAGNNVTLATATAAGALTVTIGDLPSKISYYQNTPIGNAGQPVISYSGAITSNFLSSMFLQRITLPAAMALTEVDLAMGFSFPATNQGAGTLSQSFQLLSFPAGNTTSLGNVLSASASYTWSTGTAATGGSSNQGGWSVPLIHPLTFASSTISAGEYVAAHLLNFGQGSSTWTAQLFGPANSITNSTTVSNVTAINSTAGTAISLTQTSAYSRVEIGTTFTVSTSLTAFSAGPTGITAISTVSGVTASLVPQYLTVPSFIFQSTLTAGNNPNVFVAGAFSTGATAASIALANITFSGTVLAAVPYMALVGT